MRLIDADALIQAMCKLCNQDYSDEPCAPSDCIFMRAAREAPTLTPPNEPLTLEQLREMEDPVWCVRKTVEGFEGFWCLCNHGYILTPARQIFDVKEIPHWVFYRRPPEGEA